MGKDGDAPKMIDWLPEGVAWSVLQTSLAVLVYALIVNLFYDIISKRRMFVKQADVDAEKEIETKLQQAEDAEKENKELVARAKDDEARQAAQDAAEESRAAAAEAMRDIRRQMAQGNVSIWFRELRALFIFPLVGFLFFILLSANLVFIGSQRPPLEIFSLSMAILLAVRIAAYISEPTAHDLAKMLPLALLGFYLINRTFAGIAEGNEALLEFINQWPLILRFLLLLTAVELVLRIIFLISRNLRWRKWLKRSKPAPAPKEPEAPVAPTVKPAESAAEGSGTPPASGPTSAK